MVAETEMEEPTQRMDELGIMCDKPAHFWSNSMASVTGYIIRMESGKGHTDGITELPQ